MTNVAFKNQVLAKYTLAGGANSININTTFRNSVEAKYKIVEKIKGFAKKVAKAAIHALVALGLFSGVAYGKDVSKLTHKFETSMNKILVDVGANLSCKTKDLGGKGYTIRCTITDAEGKKSSVDLIHAGDVFSDVKLSGDRGSEAMQYGQELYNSMAKSIVENKL